MEDQRKPLAQHLQPLMLHLIQQLPQAAVRLNKQVGCQPLHLQAQQDTSHSLPRYGQTRHDCHYY